MNAPIPNIRRAFDSAFQVFCRQNGFDWEKDVAFPNRPFHPDSNKLYMQPYLILSEPESASLGEDGFERFSGIYQISIYEVSGNGMGQVEELSKKLIERFKTGSILDACGLQVRITRAFQDTAVPEDTRLHVPVSVNWFCYGQRT